jgi:hypothetical protein
MMGQRTCFRAGSALLLGAGLGHFVLIDVLTLWNRSSVGHWLPSTFAVDAMKHTTLELGVLGSTSLWLATCGFSFLLALSLVFFGATLLAISAQPKVQLRPFIALAGLATAVFCAVAAVCFIWAPAAAGGVGIALFAVSWLRKEA